jgi:hypothetical protein
MLPGTALDAVYTSSHLVFTTNLGGQATYLTVTYLVTTD